MEKQNEEKEASGILLITIFEACNLRGLCTIDCPEIRQ